MTEFVKRSEHVLMYVYGLILEMNLSTSRNTWLIEQGNQWKLLQLNVSLPTASPIGHSFYHQPSSAVFSVSPSLLLRRSPSTVTSPFAICHCCLLFSLDLYCFRSPSLHRRCRFRPTSNFLSLSYLSNATVKIWLPPMSILAVSPPFSSQRCPQIWFTINTPTPSSSSRHYPRCNEASNLLNHRLQSLDVILIIYFPLINFLFWVPMNSRI